MARAAKGPGAHAPDGGWGWLVVLASFLLQALTIGITYTFGVLFVRLLEVFDAGESETAWIGSIQPCLLYLTGIIAGPLIRRFGWRLVTIVGSFISAVGFFASSFAPNIYLLYFTYGVLTGIGNGLMYVTSMVAVQHYFDKKRAMATGLAVSGSGVGTLTFGLLTQALLDSVDWQWTLRIQALLILIGVLCGALYRPLSKTGDIDDEKVTLRGEKDPEQYGAAKVANREVSVEEPAPGCCAGCVQLLTETFDLSLFKNPIFVLFCISIVMFCFGYHVPYTYTPERAGKMGVAPDAASFLVSIMGIANVVSRLLFGWVADRSTGIRFYLGGVVLTLGGLISVLISFFDTHGSMIAYSILFGAFTGCWASLFPVIVVDLLGIEVIEKSLGQALAAGSIAFLVASPMSGWIIAETGSYDLPYQVVGAAEMFGGLVYFCILFLRKRWGYQPLEEEEEPGTPRLKRKRYVSESFT